MRAFWENSFDCVNPICRASGVCLLKSSFRSASLSAADLVVQLREDQIVHVTARINAKCIHVVPSFCSHYPISICRSADRYDRKKRRREIRRRFWDCQKTLECSFAIESRGKSEGAKRPLRVQSSSFSNLIRLKNWTGSGAKSLFRHAEKRRREIRRRLGKGRGQLPIPVMASIASYCCESRFFFISRPSMMSRSTILPACEQMTRFVLPSASAITAW